MKKQMRDEELMWKEISRDHIVRDQWIDFRRSAYRYPDGRVFEPFYSYSRRDYVVIVATYENGDYICVRQFRQGIRAVTTEFPAGGIERTDGREYRDGDATGHDAAGAEAGLELGAEAGMLHQDTDPGSLWTGPAEPCAEDGLEAARRELLEETGCVSDHWEHLLTIPSNATITDNYAMIYRAENCRRVSSQDLDETEVLRVETVSPAELERMVYSGEFSQAVHVMAWLLSKKRVSQDR